MIKKTDLTPPGPGPWEHDYSHFERPLPRYGADVFCKGFTEGQEIGFERAGFPIRRVALATVEGFPYVQFQPLIGSPANTRLPPKWLFKLVGALHPALRKRYRTARSYLAQRRWRDEVCEWDEVLKPTLVAMLEELSAQEPATLTDEQLLTHLDGCREGMLQDLRIHFIVGPTTFVPVGRFLAAADDWTGASTAELLALLSQTTVTHNPTLQALLEALRSAGREELLAPNGTSAAAVITVLLDAGGTLGHAAHAWISAMNVRQLSAGDLSTPNGGEVPELLIAELRQALAGASRRPERASDVDAIRERVPADRRAEFDDLLAEARYVYRIRDERCTMLDVWAMGLCRRALLEVGSRLTERGALQARDHVLELDHAELVALVGGGKGPGAGELAERVRVKRSRTSADAPRFLGGEPPPPPPLDYFPAPVAEMMRAVFRYVDDMNGTMEAEAAEEATVLKGRAASGGIARGIARFISGPSDFIKVRPGDILIASTTMPSYNGVLPLLSGIVTDFGGALCHAAIVAREYGIPAVVNTRFATSTIADGATIEIDGDKGTVRILV